MFDACWTKYPTGDGLLAHLRAVREGKEALHATYLGLAFECEWGHVGHVLEDFLKLVECRAPLKLLAFCYQDEGPGSFQEVAGLCQTMAGSDRTGAEYVLLGWRSAARWADRHQHRQTLVFRGGAI